MELREKGLKVGMLRPKTLFPFPKKRLQELAKTTRAFLAAEMSNGQMVDDVRLAIEHKRPVEFFGTFGGNLPDVEELKAAIERAYRGVQWT
jgi:pyruvate/2-oxoacid:ferredoxin oxidoreductase alpha subunit